MKDFKWGWNDAETDGASERKYYAEYLHEYYSEFDEYQFGYMIYTLMNDGD